MNKKRAAALYAASCESGAAVACTNLAVTVRATDPKLAAWALEKACGTDADACGYLGELYRKGEGVTKDPAKARSLFEEACRRESARGCADLGAHFNEVGDDEHALPYLQKACTLGDVDVCEVLQSRTSAVE